MFAIRHNSSARKIQLHSSRWPYLICEQTHTHTRYIVTLLPYQFFERFSFYEQQIIWRWLEIILTPNNNKSYTSYLLANIIFIYLSAKCRQIKFLILIDVHVSHTLQIFHHTIHNSFSLVQPIKTNSSQKPTSTQAMHYFRFNWFITTRLLIFFCEYISWSKEFLMTLRIKTSKRKKKNNNDGYMEKRMLEQIAKNVRLILRRKTIP